ncbi:hypothetical protein PanWU01x14_263960, partial [Parasponia andersonii]
IWDARNKFVSDNKATIPLMILKGRRDRVIASFQSVTGELPSPPLASLPSDLR